MAFTPFQFEYPRLCIGVATISALNAIACPSALSTSSPRADWVTRLHCLRIDGDEGPRQRGSVGDREAAARCNFFTKPYLRVAAVGRAVCLAGHGGLEPANPSASYLIGFV